MVSLLCPVLRYIINRRRYDVWVADRDNASDERKGTNGNIMDEMASTAGVFKVVGQ